MTRQRWPFLQPSRNARVVSTVSARALIDEKPTLISFNALRDRAPDDIRKSMTAEVAEFQARKLLSKHEQLILNQIERKRRQAAYGLSINDTRTQTITQKSTAVTKVAVSQRLKQSFKDELAGLHFRHVEVELTEAGGSEGVLYHKVVLTRAPGVELPRVVSEGEQRCLSIAAFLPSLAPPTILLELCSTIQCLHSITDGARVWPCD